MSECQTPGCVYTVNALPYYSPSSYGKARIEMNVQFPRGRSLCCPQMWGWESTPPECPQMNPASIKWHDDVTEILHKHLERAIAEVAEYDRVGYGGTMNQDWPSYGDAK
jgi:hypothetical protein